MLSKMGERHPIPRKMLVGAALVGGSGARLDHHILAALGFGHEAHVAAG